jgi:hypothetical protein
VACGLAQERRKGNRPDPKRTVLVLIYFEFSS